MNRDEWVDIQQNNTTYRHCWEHRFSKGGPSCFVTYRHGKGWEVQGQYNKGWFCEKITNVKTVEEAKQVGLTIWRMK